MPFQHHLFTNFKVPAPKNLNNLKSFLKEHYKELSESIASENPALDSAMAAPEESGQDLDCSSSDEELITFHADVDFSDTESPEPGWLDDSLSSFNKSHS